MVKFIQAIDLCYRYRLPSGEALTALEGINLEIKPGEFVGIVGPNGSGKSTLARHFNALLKPTAGRVLIDGRDTARAENLWDIRQRVAMVFSNPDNQLVAPLVEEDVAFGPENLGLPAEEIGLRVEEALARVSMLEYRRRPSSQLSGGQKQRVAIAGALAMRPRYLVLDEPTSMLDSAGRREVLRFLYQLNRDLGITVILITHHLEELLEADRVILMAAGRIVGEGAPLEWFGSPEHLQQLSLELPAILELVRKLRQRGVAVPPPVTSPKALVDFLTGAGS